MAKTTAKTAAKKVTSKTAVKKTSKAAPKAVKTTAKKPVTKKLTAKAAKAAAAKPSSKKKTEVLKGVDFVTSSKEDIMKFYAQSEGDTGSPEIQIALLTQRILLLQGHLKGHKKDNHSRRGLLQMVGKRRRLLEYLKRSDLERHQKMLKAIDVSK